MSTEDFDSADGDFTANNCSPPWWQVCFRLVLGIIIGCALGTGAAHFFSYASGYPPQNYIGTGLAIGSLAMFVATLLFLRGDGRLMLVRHVVIHLAAAGMVTLCLIGMIVLIVSGEWIGAMQCAGLSAVFAIAWWRWRQQVINQSRCDATA